MRLLLTMFFLSVSANCNPILVYEMVRFYVDREYVVIKISESNAMISGNYHFVATDEAVGRPMVIDIPVIVSSSCQKLSSISISVSGNFIGAANSIYGRLAEPDECRFYPTLPEGMKYAIYSKTISPTSKDLRVNVAYEQEYVSGWIGYVPVLDRSALDRSRTSGLRKICILTDPGFVVNCEASYTGLDWNGGSAFADLQVDKAILVSRKPISAKADAPASSVKMVKSTIVCSIHDSTLSRGVLYGKARWGSAFSVNYGNLSGAPNSMSWLLGALSKNQAVGAFPVSVEFCQECERIYQSHQRSGNH